MGSICDTSIEDPFQCAAGSRCAGGVCYPLFSGDLGDPCDQPGISSLCQVGLYCNSASVCDKVPPFDCTTETGDASCQQAGGFCTCGDSPVCFLSQTEEAKQAYNAFLSCVASHGCNAWETPLPGTCISEYCAEEWKKTYVSYAPSWQYCSAGDLVDLGSSDNAAITAPLFSLLLLLSLLRT
jgi:hypothetical protein